MKKNILLTSFISLMLYGNILSNNQTSFNQEIDNQVEPALNLNEDINDLKLSYEVMKIIHNSDSLILHLIGQEKALYDNFYKKYPNHDSSFNKKSVRELIEIVRIFASSVLKVALPLLNQNINKVTLIKKKIKNPEVICRVDKALQDVKSGNIALIDSMKNLKHKAIILETYLPLIKGD